MSEDNAIEIARARLAEMRKQRMAAQRKAAESTTVFTALERTSRDRSALSSPAIEVERERVQRLRDELVESYDEIDHIRVLLGRVKRSAPGRGLDLTMLEKLLDAESAERNAFSLNASGTLAQENDPRG